MSNQSHRTCVRMSAEEYQALKEKSKAVGLSVNAWLMVQLENNRPVLHREKETWEMIQFMDEVGREINIVARDFNSGYGTTEQLRSTVRRLNEVYEQLHSLRKKGLHLRRFHVSVRNQRTGGEETITVTVTKEQLQAAQMVGQSSKELIERLGSRQGYTALEIGKADKLSIPPRPDGAGEGV